MLEHLVDDENRLRHGLDKCYITPLVVRRLGTGCQYESV